MAYAFPVRDEEAVKAALEEVNQIHPKARHFCYAYRLGTDGNRFRANDDGEPSGSAGRPILGQLDSFEVTNTLVVVVRYFGGTKLGVPGLINAYKISTAEALSNSYVVTSQMQDYYKMTFDYAMMGEIMAAIKRCNLEIMDTDFVATPSLTLAIPSSQVEDKLLQLKALILKVSLEEAQSRADEDSPYQLSFLKTW